MATIVSQISYSAIYSDANQRKHQSSTSMAFVTGEFPTKRASNNTENVSIWWHHHAWQWAPHVPSTSTHPFREYSFEHDVIFLLTDKQLSTQNINFHTKLLWSCKNTVGHGVVTLRWAQVDIWMNGLMLMALTEKEIITFVVVFWQHLRKLTILW